MYVMKVVQVKVNIYLVNVYLVSGKCLSVKIYLLNVNLVTGKCSIGKGFFIKCLFCKSLMFIWSMCNLYVHLLNLCLVIIYFVISNGLLSKCLRWIFIC